jgi:chromate transporter
VIYLQLLWSFIQIGLYSFGGGYAALPFIQQQVVNIRGWLTLTEFADVITISQMTPGPISINAASFVGRRVGGLLGSIVATFGNVLPSLVIILILAAIFNRYRSLKVMDGILHGLRPAVVALIASAGLSILFLTLFGSEKTAQSLADISFYAVILFVIGFIVLRRKRINPILVIVGSGLITLIFYFLGFSF